MQRSLPHHYNCTYMYSAKVILLTLVIPNEDEATEVIRPRVKKNTINVTFQKLIPFSEDTVHFNKHTNRTLGSGGGLMLIYAFKMLNIDSSSFLRFNI